VDLALPDEVPHGRCCHHHLAGHHAPGPVRGRQEGLGDHCDQRLCQLDPDLLLLVCGEHVDDAVHSLRRAARVQGAEHQVPGLRRGEGQGDGLQVPHLAYQDDVGVLPERRSQPGGERRGVHSDLALVYHSQTARVDELDRVFQCDDVSGAALVDEVHHGRQRG
jgi:hypothetical protein